MPIVGTRETQKPGSIGYSHDPIMGYAKEFLNLTSSIIQEGSVDLYERPDLALRRPVTNESLKNFFIESSYDPNGMSSEEIQDHVAMMEAMYENDREGILKVMNEHAGMGQYNPVIGMTFPVHKNIMMNCIFDKGAIPKMVAISPKFTVSMETRWLVDPDTGEKIDMWKEQYKMTDIIEKAAPLKSMFLKLPENQNTNILQELFGLNSRHDNLSIESYISGIVASRVVFPQQTIQVAVDITDVTAGITRKYTDVMKYTNTTDDCVIAKDAANLDGITGTTTINNPDGTTTQRTIAVLGGVFNWSGKFVPGYGSYDRQLMEQFAIPVVTAATKGTLEGTWDLTVADGTVVQGCTSENVYDANKVTGFISGFMKDNRFGITCADSVNIAGVILTARVDTSSAMLRTPSVSWSIRTDIIEIPNRIPINVTISPEEVKDIAALYQINQLTKTMSLMKTSLNNYKDDLIRRELDKSFVEMPNDSKIARSFDFAPSQNYMLDPIEWRCKTFMDALDTHVTQLLHVLNDPNMTINIIGRDDLIRKITPTEYTYQSPSSIGPVELDFVKTVVTSDRRTYQFMSSDKLRDTNNLMILLCPRNSDRFIYRIYDYQMYLSNEIRNAENPSLPAVHAFERWVVKSYQPVQGRLRILNPTGLRNYSTDYAFNNDPIGRGDGMGVASVGKNDFDIDAR